MYDCIIIGGGTAGLSAAVNMAQRGKQAVVLTAGESLLAKAELVNNYLGLPEMSGSEMMDTFEKHVKQMNVEIKHAKASNVLANDGDFAVNIGDDILTSKSIILACGAAKAKPVAGESEFLGRGVSYCATCDGMLYRNRNVAVWGLSEEAVHEANFLNGIGCKVMYVAGQYPDGLDEKITYVHGRIEEISGEATVKTFLCGGVSYSADCIFILRQAVPTDALISGIEMNGTHVIINENGATNIDGVYAAGDMTGTPYQVSKAVGDAQCAALSCSKYIDDKNRGQK